MSKTSATQTAVRRGHSNIFDELEVAICKLQTKLDIDIFPASLIERLLELNVHLEVRPGKEYTMYSKIRMPNVNKQAASLLVL